MRDYKPEILSEEQDFIFTSNGAKKIEVSGGPQVQIVGSLDATLQGQWQFGRKNGALLAMARPRMKTLPYNFPYLKLTDIRALSHKSIVVNTSICPSFALYLSQQSDDVVALNLGASAPIPQVPILSVGAKVGTSWKAQAASGFSRVATAKDPIFTPMYSLRINKPRFWTKLRGASAEPHTGCDVLENAPLPWDILDENGEEQSVDD